MEAVLATSRHCVASPLGSRQGRTRYHDGESGGFNCAQAIYPDGYDVVVLGNTWDQYPGAFNPLEVMQAVHAALPP